MAIWEAFEVQCANHLNNRFGAYAQFTLQGGANSTVPDILVKTKAEDSFYIEAKHSPAQCGQFVLIPNVSESVFEYSKQNTSKLNVYARKIIEHMNDHFDRYRNAGTAGESIVMENGSQTFKEWIIQTYKEKGTRFFITNNYTIFPIEQLHDFFDVSASYRIKRSGSSSVGKIRIPAGLDYIETRDYHLTGSRVHGDRIFVKSHAELHNIRFIIHGYEYMFSRRSSEFEIRKLSNTYNANVIFSIKQINKKSGLSDEEFIWFLR